VSNPTALVQKLWNYCNILRDDGLSYGDYVEQLTFGSVAPAPSGFAPRFAQPVCLVSLALRAACGWLSPLRSGSLATGGSAVRTCEILRAVGIPRLVFLALIASPQGVETLAAAVPDIDREQTRQAIEVALAVGVIYIGAVAVVDDGQSLALNG
jgi:hypothetical protein